MSLVRIGRFAVFTRICVLVMAACGGTSVEDEARRSSPAVAPNVELSPATPVTLVSPETTPLVLTLKSLDAITETILPAIAEENGLDDVELGNVVIFETHILCWDWTFGIRNTELSVPIRSDSVDAEIRTGNELHAEIDVDASFEATVYLKRANVSTSIFCLGDSVKESAVTVEASGLHAELTAELTTGSSKVLVSSIDDLEAEITSVSFDGDGILDLLAEVAVALYDLFNGDCSNITSCVNDAIDELVLTSDDLSEKLEDTFNDAISTSLSLDSSATLDGASVDFAASLEELETDSEGTASATFDLDLSSDATASGCADALRWSAPVGGEGGSTSADFDLQIPAWVIAKSLYLAGKQGVFCQTVSLVYSGRAYNARIIPSGTLSVDLSRFSLHPVATSPLLPGSTGGTVIATPSSDVDVKLPVTLSLTGGNVRGTFAATVTARFLLSIDPANGLYAEYAGLDLSGLSGELIFAGLYHVDAATYDDEIEDGFEAGVGSSLDRIQLLPKITEIADTGWALEIEDLATTDTHLTVGLSIVE
jgi:hypothetical protein